MASILLLVVTAIYVVLIFKSNLFSENYAKFKITDDLGKESEHEILSLLKSIRKYYLKYTINNQKFIEPSNENEKDEFSVNLLRIYNYFDRVYLNYKYNKLDRNIFLEQLSHFIVTFKEHFQDEIITEMVDEEILERRKNFLKLYKICKNYLDNKNSKS